MFRSLSFAAVATVAALASAPASAGVYQFTYTGLGYTVSGDVTTDGVNQVTAISGTVNGPTTQTISGIVTNPAFPGYSTSPDGQFYYDNYFNPAANPIVSYWGLLFTTAENPAGFWNLYSDNGTYQLLNSTGGGWQTLSSEGSLVVTAVPEPATWALMLLGFAGLGFVAMRKGRLATATA